MSMKMRLYNPHEEPSPCVLVFATSTKSSFPLTICAEDGHGVSQGQQEVQKWQSHSDQKQENLLTSNQGMTI